MSGSPRIAASGPITWTLWKRIWIVTSNRPGTKEVRDRDAAAAHAPARLLAREPELLDERSDPTRGLDGVEVLARHVLHEGDLERRGLVVLLDQPGDLLGAGELRRTPVALARDELVATSGPGPHEHRWIGRDGGELVVEWSLTPIRDAQGQQRVLLTGLDVSDRARHEAPTPGLVPIAA